MIEEKQMELKIAKSAGFCFGVQRAAASVYKEIEKNNGPIYTFGPIIHNEQVVEDLESKGVSVIETEDDLDTIEGGTVIIRSHGISRAVYEHIESRKVKIIDATCPFVKKIHKIVESRMINSRL